MNAVPNATAMAYETFALIGVEGLRLAPCEGARSRPDGIVDGNQAGFDWPGKGYGIRPPAPWETPLSIEEVGVALRDIRGTLCD